MVGKRPRNAKQNQMAGGDGKLHSPLGLLAELTHRCPLGCPYCSNPLMLDPRGEELDTETWARVFKEAAGLGVLQVHLSGGEPGARRDLVEITAAAHICGLYTNLITSAVGITAATLRKLAESGLDHVQISIQDYIANQVFLEIGGHRLGGPVSLEKSLMVANEMLAAHGLTTAIHLEEGSGVSRDNRFTARGLAKVLGLFAPHAGLLHGHDGGMNKTGTMDGIRALAGYADTSSRGRVRFVISLTSNDDEMRFRLLRAIESGL
jgi:hypothetical protein